MKTIIIIISTSCPSAIASGPSAIVSGRLVDVDFSVWPNAARCRQTAGCSWHALRDVLTSLAAFIYTGQDRTVI